MQEQQVVGLDIGGATLKAYAAGRAYARRFPLWRQPEGLADALRELLSPIPNIATARLAVTMTGELCDCFATKADGVRSILDSVEGAFPAADILVWQTNDQFVGAQEAKERVYETAAANFLALAWVVARLLPADRVLLIDIGSTTTDLIPIVDGRPTPRGRTDRARLASGELIYQGVERTPVCALVEQLTVNDIRHHVMNELFATTLDAYLLTGDLAEESDETMTADGRPATKEHARDRLARMIGADRTTFSEVEAMEAARQVSAAQYDAIVQAFERAAAWRDPTFDVVVLAGQGEWLARRVLNSAPSLADSRIESLTERLGLALSRCACAYGVAELAAACFASERQ